MNHERRMEASDRKAAPKFFYVYVLKLEDGGYYVGHTNNPTARWTEHSIGVGAVGTAGKNFKVEMVQQFGTRREARYNENRLQAALDHSPANIKAMIDNFERINRMIRPEKTLRELEREAMERHSVGERRIHKWRAQGLRRFAECGWEPDSTQMIEVPGGARLPGWRPMQGTQQFSAYHYPEDWDWDRLAGAKDACPDCLSKRPASG